MAAKFIWNNIKSEVEFLNKFPILLQSTTDNDSPIPGYLFGEINALTYISDGVHCQQLVAYFISRSEGNSHLVKFKALKILLHLAKNGHRMILEELKRHEVNLKEIAGCSLPSQDFLEKSRYENIRKMATELLTLAFSENSPEYPPEVSFKGSTTGYGSQATTNKLSGFGNTPNVSKNIGERMAEGFTGLVDKILSPTNENDFYKKQAVILNDSLPQYQPVTVEKSNTVTDIYTTELEASKLSKSPGKSRIASNIKKPVHVAGRAGGGWDDSEDETEQDAVISLEGSVVLSISADSLENKKEMPAPLEYVEEQSIVDSFAVDVSLENLKYEEIASLCKKCSSLNCDKILEFLIVKFSDDKEKVKLRCLVFIEYLLHQDIVNLESLIKIALPILKQLSEAKKSSVQIKSKKICLIIDCMTKTANVSNNKVNKA